MKKLLITYILLMLTTIISYAQTTQQVVDSLKQVKSFTADFTQATEIEGFGEDVYSGKLYIKAGEKALWDYDKPYKQFYLFDKTTMKYYDSDTNQMIVQALDPATNVFMRLMLNPADIETDFTLTLSGDELTLAPKADLGIETIIFVIKNGMVHGIKTKDQSGNNTRIEFKNIKRDAVISDAAFSPEIPEGTEVFNY